MIITRLGCESLFAETPGIGLTVGVGPPGVGSGLVAHAARTAEATNATTVRVVLCAMRWIGDIRSCSVSWWKAVDRSVVAHGKLDRHHRTAAGPVGRDGATAVCLRDGEDDRQSETCAAGVAAAGRLGAVEPLEGMRQELGRDPRSLVGDGYGDHARAGRGRREFDDA